MDYLTNSDTTVFYLHSTQRYALQQGNMVALPTEDESPTEAE